MASVSCGIVKELLDYIAIDGRIARVNLGCS